MTYCYVNNISKFTIDDSFKETKNTNYLRVLQLWRVSSSFSVRLLLMLLWHFQSRTGAFDRALQYKFFKGPLLKIKKEMQEFCKYQLNMESEKQKNISLGHSSSSSIFIVNIITPTSRGDILRQMFHQCISHESNAWRKRCVFRPDLQTGKEQGARMWSGNVIYYLYANLLFVCKYFK